MICLLVKWIMDLTNNLGTYKIGVYDVISEPTKAFKINKRSERPTETLQNTKWTHSAISSNMVNPARSWSIILTYCGGSVCDQAGLSFVKPLLYSTRWARNNELRFGVPWENQHASQTIVSIWISCHYNDKWENILTPKITHLISRDKKGYSAAWGSCNQLISTFNIRYV